VAAQHHGARFTVRPDASVEYSSRQRSVGTRHPILPKPPLMSSRAWLITPRELGGWGVCQLGGASVRRWRRRGRRRGSWWLAAASPAPSSPRLCRATPTSSSSTRKASSPDPSLRLLPVCGNPEPTGCLLSLTGCRVRVSLSGCACFHGPGV
jgi:hypothetical protein